MSPRTKQKEMKTRNQRKGAVVAVVYNLRSARDTFALNNKEFTHQCRVDVTDPSEDFMPGTLRAGTDDNSLELQAKLDKE